MTSGRTLGVLLSTALLGTLIADAPWAYLGTLLLAAGCHACLVHLTARSDDMERAYWAPSRSALCAIALFAMSVASGPEGYFLHFTLPLLLYAPEDSSTIHLDRPLSLFSATLGALYASDALGTIALQSTLGIAMLLSQKGDRHFYRQALHASELKRKGEQASATARSRMLGSLSHEVRGPLESILGSIELLRGASLSSQQRELADAAEGAGRVLRRIVNDALEYTKLESGDLEITPVPTRTRKAIKSCVDSAKPGLRRDTQLLLNFAANVPVRISIDSTRLRQVVGNLLDNATRFTTVGVIEVRISYEGSRLFVCVEDTGCGIREAELPQIFDAFHQGGDQATGGTGLGLAICRRLVHLMGGWIHVESVPNEGSSFSFDLAAPELSTSTEEEEAAPLSAAALLQAPSRPPASLAPPPFEFLEEEQSGLVLTSKYRNEAKEHLTVLLADDNDINLRVTQLMLEELGCKVHTAADGLDALRCSSRGSFDLVFMDCEMPVMNGWDAAARIHRIQPQLPIIALTADALPQNRDRCADAGMSGFLAKPVRMTDLRGQIAELTGRSCSPSALTMDTRQ